jgi:apolipoprotein N-acyltransferase
MTWLLAGLSGLLLVLIFPKFDLTLLVAFALVPLLVAIAREPNWRRRLLLGELCGFVFWMGVCYWIRPVLAAYGGLTPSLAWLTVVLFALVKGLHTAVFAAAAGCVIHRAWAIPAIADLHGSRWEMRERIWISPLASRPSPVYTDCRLFLWR